MPERWECTWVFKNRITGKYMILAVNENNGDVACIDREKWAEVSPEERDELIRKIRSKNK